MKRIKEEFLENLEKTIKLKGKEVLEIGCGMGTRSIRIAKKVKHIIAIEPNSDLINEAKKSNSSENITYQVGKAEKLKFDKGVFDIVIFTLSLHHVPALKIPVAIEEAIRVCKKNGYIIIFLEPTYDGNFSESEIKFDACDGDERKEKALAYYSILNFKGYKEIAEIDDETVFQFDSYEDFVKSMNPKKNKKDIKDFLERNNYILSASRRISIFQVK